MSVTATQQVENRRTEAALTAFGRIAQAEYYDSLTAHGTVAHAEHFGNRVAAGILRLIRNTGPTMCVNALSDQLAELDSARTLALAGLAGTRSDTEV